MRVMYTGENSTFRNKAFKLNGDDAWTEPRFKVLKEMNPKGKVCVIEVKDDQERDKYLVQIGELAPAEEPRNY